MKYLIMCVILTLLTTVATKEGLDSSLTASSFTSLNDTTVVMKRISRNAVEQIRVESPTLLPPPYLQLPVFQHSSLPLVEKEYFNPAKGTGYEQLPVKVWEVLFPVSPTAKPSTLSIESSGVITWCNVTQMHVHVQKSILGAYGSSSDLRFGTCNATKSTKDLLYFEYDLGLCGNKRTIINNHVAYSNTLRYDPPRLTGPIRRAVPFTLPIACYYNRYYYSYKIGYIPRIQMRKIFKAMKSRVQFILTPHNAQWERLSPSDLYVIGKPMYFQAEARSLDLSEDERLYVHSCHATPNKSHSSMPQFPVVENFGCMVESKANRSRFIPYKKDIVRFSVDAFLFKEMTGQQLYMHCAMSVGGSVSIPAAKSCNYDTKEGGWQELYDSTSVCSCCDSKCSSAAPTVTKMVSSIPWTVEYIDPTTTPKRTVEPKTTPKGMIFKPVKTPVALTMTSRTMMTKTRKTPQPKEEGKGMAKIEVGEVVRELEWPFGGDVVTWMEEEEDKSMKGFTVVEEERVSEPRITPWTIDYIDPTTTPKRTVEPKTTPKGIIFKSLTTPVAITVTSTPTTKGRTMIVKSRKMMTKTRKTPQPKAKGKGMAKIEVGEVVRELEWPFGGGVVTWMEEEGDEKSVKGIAVVEEERVSEPLVTKTKTPQLKEEGKGMAKIEVEEVVGGLERPFGGSGVSWIEEEGDEKSVKGIAVVEEEHISGPHIIPWTVDYIDSTTTQKRTTVKPKTTPKGTTFKPVTTPVAITMTTTPTTKSRTMMSKTRKTPQPKEKGKEMAKIEVEEVVRGLEWPFGGGVVMWMEDEWDKFIKGFAVVEEERVSEPLVTKTKTPQLKEEGKVMAKIEVEEVVGGLERPFGGGGVMWKEEEGDEKSVKGIAVVEEELVSGPHIIPWTVEYIDSTTTPKRTTVKPKTPPKGMTFKPVTTTVAITMMTTPTTKSRTMMSKTRKTPQSKEKGKEMAKIEVEEVVGGLEWPFGGGGMMWMEEEEDEKSVKGIAVVKEEHISEPRITPWTVEYIDPTTTPKRTVKPKTTPKGIIFKSVKTPVAITMTTTPTTKGRTMIMKSRKMMTKTIKTPQPKAKGKGMAKIEVGEVVRELEWPFGGGVVTWTEEEWDTSIKGFAVVEEERVSEPLVTKTKTPQPKEEGKGMAKIEVEEVVGGLERPFGGGSVMWIEEEEDEKTVKGIAVVEEEHISGPHIIPWTVDYIDSTTTPKRTDEPKTTPKTTPKGMIFKPVTTPVAITTTMTPTTKSRTMMTETRKTPQPKEEGKGMAKIEVGEVVGGLERPFGGGVVTWTEEEWDTSIKGFAVVEEEHISGPHIIPWTVEYIDPTTTPKRTTVKPKTTPKGMTFKPITTQRRMRVTTLVTTMNTTTMMTKTRETQFGGGGVMWTEDEGDEKSVKGIAVEKEEHISEPHITPWTVEYIESTTTPKRTVKPKMTLQGMIFRPVTTQRRLRVMMPVDGDEKSVRGFAVVKEEQVSTIFEDIFGLDK